MVPRGTPLQLVRAFRWRVVFIRALLNGWGPFWNVRAREVLPGYGLLARMARRTAPAFHGFSFPAGDAKHPLVRRETVELLRGGLYHGVRLDPRWFDGATVIDVGAYVGVFTVWALLQGANRVVAFEPEPSNVACLQQNVKLSGRSHRVTVEQRGLWSSSGSRVLVGRGMGANVVGIDADPDATGGWDPRYTGRSVAVTTLDAWAAEVNLVDRVDVIKLDVEGAETHVILGASQLIKVHRPRIICCVYHSPSQAQEVKEAILSSCQEYKVCEVGRSFWYSDDLGGEIRPVLIIATVD